MGIAPAAQSSEMFGWTFEVTNAYNGIYQDQLVTVYAGAVLAPDPSGKSAHGIPSGGGVRVSFGTPGTNAKQFLLPGTLDLLTIKAVTGENVELERSDGTMVTFNLTTDTFS